MNLRTIEQTWVKNGIINTIPIPIPFFQGMKNGNKFLFSRRNEEWELILFLGGMGMKKVKKNPIHFRPPNHYFRAQKTQKFFDDIRFLD